MCDDLFTDTNAAVVCRSLGLGEGAYESRFGGPKSLPIWLDDVECDGDEADIADCASAVWGK